jgi:hypothetical protein
MQAGINFLAFCRIKRYSHLRPTEHNCFSERVIGSGPPFEKSCKPVVATSGSGFSQTAAFGAFPGIDSWVATTGGSILRGS